MSQKLLNDELQFGLIAFTPFLLVITSAPVGIGVGLIVLVAMIVSALLFYPLRNFISIPQKFVVILIISVSIVLILKMLMEAEVYPLSEKIGFLFPLLMINSLLLSTNESLFSFHDIKAVIAYILRIGLLVLVFFLVFGGMREVLGNYTVLTDLKFFSDVSFSGFVLFKSGSGFSIFTSAAGCFFLTGFVFAIMNLINKKA